MNDKILLYALGGVFAFVLLYSLRDYLVIALVGAGAIYIHQWVSGGGNRSGRR